MRSRFYLVCTFLFALHGCHGNSVDPVVSENHNRALGPDGEVLSLLAWRDLLVVGGSFQTTGTDTTGSIVGWNGSFWVPIGDDPINGSVWAMIEYEGDLIVGGSFESAGGQPVRHIARWDGRAWHSMGSPQNWDVVRRFVVVGDDLYAEGRSYSGGSVSGTRIRVWNGSAWSELEAPGHPSRRVNDMIEWRGQLVVSGYFPEIVLSTRTVVVLENGEWKELAPRIWDGPDGQISSGPGGAGPEHLAIDEDLIASFTSSGINGSIAAVALVGLEDDQWSLLEPISILDDLNDLQFHNGFFWAASFAGVGRRDYGTEWETWRTSRCRSIAKWNSELYVGGIFSEIEGTSLQNIARFDGMEWKPPGSE